jgi:hypothetical protein
VGGSARLSRGKSSARVGLRINFENAVADKQRPTGRRFTVCYRLNSCSEAIPCACPSGMWSSNDFHCLSSNISRFVEGLAARLRTFAAAWLTPVLLSSRFTLKIVRVPPNFAQSEFKNLRTALRSWILPTATNHCGNVGQLESRVLQQ